MKIPTSLIELKDNTNAIYWRHSPKGGYGYYLYVPVEYVGLTRKRISVRALKKDGTSSLIAVELKHLRVIKKE